MKAGGLRAGGEDGPMRRAPERALAAIKEGTRSMIAPVKVQRLQANESGLSRFDTFEIERADDPYLPHPHSRFLCRPRRQRRGSFCSSCQQAGTANVTACQRAKSSSVWPEAFELLRGVGDAVTISAGDPWLMEDTTGSGHTTEVISQGPFEAVVIQLPDDALLVRP